MLNSELRFLSKKCVAFLILKSWSLARKRASEQTVKDNAAKIKEQEEFLKQHQEKIDLLLKHNDDKERDIESKGAALEERERELALTKAQMK